MGVDQPGLILPEVEAGNHLLDYLFRIGPLPGGEVVSFSEIAAWCDLTGVVLTSWEAETLRTMSAAYGSELHAAKDPKRPPPEPEDVA